MRSAAGPSSGHGAGEKRPASAYEDAPQAKKRAHHRGKRHKGATNPAAKGGGKIVVPGAEMVAAERPGPAVSPSEFGANDREGGYNSEDEYSHLGVSLTKEQWDEKDRRFERFVKKKGELAET